jgi:hypothetical protein
MTDVNNAAPAELVEVTSIPQFAAMVEVWQQNIVAQLNQGINVPDDVEVSIALKDGEDDTVLTEEMRLGFKAGLVMALSLIQDLPFQGIADSVDAPAGGDEGTAQ